MSFAAMPSDTIYTEISLADFAELDKQRASAPPTGSDTEVAITRGRW